MEWPVIFQQSRTLARIRERASSKLHRNCVAMLFQDRREAGRVLATALEPFRDRQDVVVLALPRGGVPVAYEVTKHLNVPLDVFIVRKLGAPGQEELAMGAIASGETIVMNRSVVEEFGISQEEIEAAAKREKLEIERREREYRDGYPPV